MLFLNSPFILFSSKIWSLLTNEYFWNNINCKKILLYQIDSYLFNSNQLEKYFDYDYIGAPWPHKPLNCLIGNGGFSIRNVSKIKIVCQMIKNLKRNIKHIPEDLIFAFYLKKIKAKLPDLMTSIKFSIENIYINQEDDYCGGHQFWFSLPQWDIKIKKNIEELLLNYDSVELNPSAPLEEMVDDVESIKVCEPKLFKETNSTSKVENPGAQT